MFLVVGWVSIVSHGSVHLAATVTISVCVCERERENLMLLDPTDPGGNETDF